MDWTEHCNFDWWAEDRTSYIMNVLHVPLLLLASRPPFQWTSCRATMTPPTTRSRSSLSTVACSPCPRCTPPSSWPPTHTNVTSTE